MAKSKINPWEFSDGGYPLNGDITDKIQFLLKYAILAPSSHNMQSWKFKVYGNRLELLLDVEKKLPFSDRTLRQSYISLGCALCNLLLASEHFGLHYNFELFPEDIEEDVAVKITFQNTGEKGRLRKYKDLFDQIKFRNTNRFPHIEKSVPENTINKLAQISDDFKVKVDIFKNLKQIRSIANIVSNASYEAFSHKMFKDELANWVISVRSNRKDGIPLYDIRVPYIGKRWRADQIIKNVTADQQRSIDHRSISSSSACIIVSAINDLKEEWINTGVVLEIIWLYLSSQNLSLAPMAAAIEHPETRIKMQKLITERNYAPMFFARLGYSSRSSRHSPRNTVEDVLE